MKFSLGIRFGIIHCFALIALAAVWSAVYKLKLDARRIRTELESYQDYAPVLLFDNANNLHVLAEQQEWHNEIAWQVYVPRNSSIVLRVTNTSQEAEGSNENEIKEFQLQPGRNRIVLCNSFPMLRQLGATHFEDLLLTINEDQSVLSHREIDSPVQGWFPREKNRKVFEQAPTEELVLLEPLRDLHWKVWLAPAAVGHRPRE